eukprot:6206412-Pleurochrysis_carterae.AAC.2
MNTDNRHKGDPVALRQELAARRSEGEHRNRTDGRGSARAAPAFAHRNLTCRIDRAGLIEEERAYEQLSKALASAAMRESKQSLDSDEVSVLIQLFHAILDEDSLASQHSPIPVLEAFSTR